MDASSLQSRPLVFYDDVRYLCGPENAPSRSRSVLNLKLLEIWILHHLDESIFYRNLENTHINTQFFKLR